MGYGTRELYDACARKSKTRVPSRIAPCGPTSLFIVVLVLYPYWESMGWGFSLRIFQTFHVQVRAWKVGEASLLTYDSMPNLRTNSFGMMKSSREANLMNITRKNYKALEDQ
ncbi:hypothetical protein PIB30_107260 [Stylosanthes scabra]|uniref:Uncharacterized protein n=1 Tax=Stylosanthes scabra TaxID=79078 RepID=A0ABU6XY73_9FABA|nr:hypothetical protein [Stylosanthes scabra]